MRCGLRCSLDRVICVVRGSDGGVSGVVEENREVGRGGGDVGAGGGGWGAVEGGATEKSKCSVPHCQYTE